MRHIFRILTSLLLTLAAISALHSQDAGGMGNRLKEDALNTVSRIVNKAHGFSLTAGMGGADFTTNWMLFPDDMMILLTRGSNLTIFNIGLEFDRSYLDIAFCPYANPKNDTLYIDVQTGSWLIDTIREHESEIFGIRAAFYFYGTLFSFSTPFLTSGSGGTTISRDMIEKSNGGLGFVLTGTGFRWDLMLSFAGIIQEIGGLHSLLNDVQVTLGAYINAGVILPFSPVIGMGVYGPDVEVRMLDNKLLAYLHMRILNFGYEPNHWEVGLGTSF